MSGRPRSERPIKAWYWWAMGIVLGIALVVLVVVAIINPTQEALTGLAAIVIPGVLLGADAVIRRIKSRRRRTP